MIRLIGRMECYRALHVVTSLCNEKVSLLRYVTHTYRCVTL